MGEASCSYLAAETTVSRSSRRQESPFTLNISHKNTIQTVKLFFGIVSVLAREEERNTHGLLERRKIKGFSRRLNDSAQLGDPAKGRPCVAAAPSCPKTP